jgi:hypothetical protein
VGLLETSRPGHTTELNETKTNGKDGAKYHHSIVLFGVLRKKKGSIQIGKVFLQQKT